LIDGVLHRVMKDNRGQEDRHERRWQDHRNIAKRLVVFGTLA